MRGTSWYQPKVPVPACTSPVQLDRISPPRSTNSNRLRSRAEVNGGASTNIFTAEIHCHSVAFEGLLSMRRHTERESKNYFIQLAHAVGKLCGIFLTGTCEQLTVRYGETRRFPPHYVKGCLLYTSPSPRDS